MEAQHILTKNIRLRGFPGSGNIWTIEYIVICIICKGLSIITSYMMTKEQYNLGGTLALFILLING